MGFDLDPDLVRRFGAKRCLDHIFRAPQAAYTAQLTTLFNMTLSSYISVRTYREGRI